MAGLVEEIQARALDPDVKVSDLLRRVKLAAVKLHLDDAVEWVDHELRGYSENEDVPAYRRTVGQLRAHTRFHGVVPVGGDAEWVRKVCENAIRESIAKVEVLAGDGTQEVIGQIHGSIETAMNKAHGTPGTEYYVHTPQSIFLDIIEQVRNLVLDWAIGLERAGVLGEGIGFSSEEKQIAAESAPSINIQNFIGHLHQGEVSGHQNRTVVASADHSSNAVQIDDVYEQVVQAVMANIADSGDRDELLKAIGRFRND